MIFALVGNQNCGKTTLFNALTGSNQHVGNFPGRHSRSEDGRDKRRILKLLIDADADKNNVSVYSKKSIREHYENESVWQICGEFLEK